MKLFLSLIIAFLSGVSSSLMAQAPISVDVARMEFKARQVVSPAPEAAELGKYGNTQVSLFTGTPKINVPLYELKGNSLSIPISLNFSASGFKPQEMPTWVGQNWSLNAGGVISHAVRGNPDDDHYYGESLDLPSSSDLFAFQDLLRTTKKGERELEPDLYFYNFGNYGGKFIVTPFNEVVKKEMDMLNIGVICISCGTSSRISITDDKGNSYLFADPEETKMDFGDDPELDPATVRHYTYMSSWYLSSITSADGHEKMQFEYYYTAENPIDAQNSNRSITRTYTNVVEINGSGGSNSHTNVDGSLFAPTGPFTKGKRKFLKKITLSRDNNIIAFIDFVSTTDRADNDFPGSRLLQGINIYDASSGVNKLVKQYNLGYGYYSNNNNTFIKKRLRLDTLQEKATMTGTVSPPPYLFEYYMTGSMPEKFSTSLDHWGFLNNAGNSSVIPNVTIPNAPDPNDALMGGGADREPDIDGSSYGMIKKITYPTNGYTTFEYELHDATKHDGSRRVLGGVRVKKIIDYAASGQSAMAKIYNYLLGNGASSGKCDEAFPKYITASTYRNYEPLPFMGTYIAGSGSFTVTGNSVFGLGTFQGGHIGYSMVTESQIDLSNNQPLGKTVYKYHLGALNEFDEDIANGDLEATYVYSNSGKLLSEQSNTYSYKILNTITATQVKPVESQSSKTLYCKTQDSEGYISYTSYSTNPGLPNNCLASRKYPTFLYANNYSFRAQQKSLVKQIERKYDQQSDSYITNTILNTFDNPDHIYPTKIEQYSSGTEEVVTRKKYAADYSGSSTNDGGIGLLKSKNINGAEIESYQYRQDTTGQNKRVLTGTITNYGADLQPVKLYQLETNVPLSNFQESALTSTALTMDPRYKSLAGFSYSNGVIVAQQKEKDVARAYIWDGNNSYPIAEIINSSTPKAAYTSFEEAGGLNTGWGFTNIVTNSTVAFTGKSSCNLTTGGSIDKLLLTATDKPVITSFWLQSGTVTLLRNGASLSPAVSEPVRRGWTYYEYKLPVGTMNINIRSSNAVLDELRYYPEDAQMTTYTYLPMVGMSSQTNANNLTTYYEYDGLNRLVNIRDENNNIRQNYIYNYGPGISVTPASQTLFYNNVASQQFTKNNCTAGEPTVETYLISYGKYVSSISQADANTKAQADITANGQAYANNVGLCWFYNVSVSKRFIKNDCAPDVGKFYIYDVPARKWRSTVSQAAADQLAQDDINTNGQAAANQYGSCGCSGEDKKLIDGVCETGVKNYMSSQYISAGKYLCTYNYSFSDGTHTQNYTEYSPTQCTNI
ncbi:DUF5977 domain-containing protein [Chitinophaga sp. MM2321]|uniref:DUF5977 domain-containing protein n=1 Tax=Chitinophaga sp. MM2321 TaxID=3137178 RepID=UPI0032D5803A